MKSKFFRNLLFVFFILTSGARLSASDVEYIHPFKLNPVNDGIMLGTSAVLTASSLICGNLVDFKKIDYKASEIDKADVPVFDQLFMTSYNKPLDIISYGTLGLSLVSPVIFALVPQNEWLNIGVMYAETLMFAFGTQEWAKNLISRARPYMYYDDFPQNKLDNGDWNSSMPSDNTTAAFASAAFTTYVFCQYFPDSKWRYAAAGISFGMAAVTGALRMASGCQFFSDVLAGALIGTIYGFAVPYMHTSSYYAKFEKKKIQADISPMGFNFSVSF